MTETKTFSTASILSITDGRLMCPFDEFHELIEYMIDTSILTVELLHAAESCKQYLLEQFPQFASSDDEPWQSVLDRISNGYGETQEVKRIS